jgi:uncharacterized protein
LYRIAYQKLLLWKSQKDRKPLLVQGARQVGKTWLIKEFGQKEFKHLAYFNFEQNPHLKNIFEKGYDTELIIRALNIYTNFNIDKKNTLIFFDEIQECPKAITSLKYFREENPEYAIIGAGSLLGVSIHQGISFPVGKVSFLSLYPLNFTEFLMAFGQEKILDFLPHEEAMVRPVLVDLLKTYYFTGGMPEVVQDFIQHKDYQKSREIQLSILKSYENDFSKYAPSDQLPRIRLVWESILGQLSKENSKFIYNILRSGARAKDFELALEWLNDAGLIHKINRITKPGLPLNAYAVWSDFKIYLSDVGLLCAKGGLAIDTILQGDRLFTEFKGVLSEQFVLQQLITADLFPFYWIPKEGKSEVDFIIQHDKGILPIEVKSNENLKAKSLKVYSEKYNPEICIRTSLSPYRKQDWMENLPLYGFIHLLSIRSKQQRPDNDQSAPLPPNAPQP